MQRLQLFTWTGTKIRPAFCFFDCCSFSQGRIMNTSCATINSLSLHEAFLLSLPLSCSVLILVALQDFGLQENPSGSGEIGGRCQGHQKCHHRPKTGSDLFYLPWYWSHLYPWFICSIWMGFKGIFWTSCISLRVSGAPQWEVCVSTASAPTTAPQNMLCVDAPPGWRPLWPSCCRIWPWRNASPGGHPGDAPTAAASWQS